MKNFRSALIITSILIFGSINIGQVKTNLDQFNSLIENSVKIIAEKAGNSRKTYDLEITAPAQYLVFRNRIVNSFSKTSLDIKNDNGSNSSISYSLENAAVEYSDLFRDGLFGDYLLERKVDISGVFNIKEEGLISEEFNLSDKDTVAYDSLNEIENPAFPFTQGEVPAEPFLSGLLEPAIAIGTAALTIILFFTVRSK